MSAAHVVSELGLKLFPLGQTARRMGDGAGGVLDDVCNVKTNVGEQLLPMKYCLQQSTFLVGFYCAIVYLHF